ncbi:MAG: hypothetical protein ISS66_09520 [Desulfobacteraceae bacterium]|nr:hypothetical protein [Desulfobacteraceae bacterium]
MAEGRGQRADDGRRITDGGRRKAEDPPSLRLPTSPRLRRDRMARRQRTEDGRTDDGR